MELYVLRLSEGKYYVDLAESAEIGFAQHFSGSGPKWTQKYAPIEIVEVFHDADKSSCNAITKKYMARYGIDNVRGGDYNRRHLSQNQVDTLMSELKVENNKCYRCAQVDHVTDDCGIICIRCGRANHQAEDCRCRYDINGNSLVVCGRCGRSNHMDEECFSLVTVNGASLPSSPNSTPNSSPRFAEDTSPETPLRFKTFNSEDKYLQCNCLIS